MGMICPAGSPVRPLSPAQKHTGYPFGAIAMGQNWRRWRDFSAPWSDFTLGSGALIYDTLSACLFADPRYTLLR